MQSRNPYATPQSNVLRGDEPVEDYGKVEILSASGRLGRVRYIGYSTGVSLLLMLAMVVLAGIAGLVEPQFAAVAVIVGYVAILVVHVLLTIQRSHDMNVSGWLSLVSFVPLGVLVFWLVPGTQGENRYGKQPPPNTTGVILLACLLPLLGGIGGIVGAIAIPAYQDYTIRAQVSEGLNLAQGPKIAVTEAFTRTRSVPRDRVAAGMSADPTDTAGQYVEAIEIDRGTIFVVYGERANSFIAGRVLALQPYVAGGDVFWRCAAGSVPGGAEQLDAYAPDSALETDIEPRFLPSACRP